MGSLSRAVGSLKRFFTTGGKGKAEIPTEKSKHAGGKEKKPGKRRRRKTKTKPGRKPAPKSKRPTRRFPLHQKLKRTGAIK